MDDDGTGQVPPNDFAAEQACLGAMLLAPAAIEQVAGLIGPSEYYTPKHGTVHSAITALYAGGQPTDPVAVGRYLAERGELGRIGGATYLHTLIQAVPTVAQAGYYAGLVADLARQRQVDVLGLRVRQAAAGLVDQEKLSELAAELAALARGGGRAAAGLPFIDGVSFTAHRPGSRAVWGNDELAVWAAGESLMVFGPPGIGKSTLIHLLVFGRLGLLPGPLGWPVRDDGGRVLYCAMDRPQQIARAMARLVQPQHEPVLRERLVVWSGPLPFDVTRERHRMADICQELGVTTVVIDSVKDCVPNPSDEEAAGGYNLARQVALARGVEWIEGHHNRKGQAENKTPNTLDDVYGNRWLTAGAGSVLCLWGKPGDPTATLSQLKSPGEFISAGKVVIDFWLGSIGWEEHRLSEEELIAARGPEGVTVADVARLAEGLEQPTPADLKRIRNRLDQRVNRGKLVSFEHPVDGLKRWRAAEPATTLEIPPDDEQGVLPQ